MKNIILSMLSVAMLVGCSKNENIIDGEAANGLVPIKLNSGIELASRAAITTDATVQIGCWESSAGSATYTNTANWISSASVNVDNTAAAITLSPVRYYNADNGIKSYLKGWYPAGTFANGAVTITNTDGTVDAILSNEVSGSKSTVIGTAMNFEHLTAQLKFLVIKGDGLATGTKIKSITVKGASVPTAINLAKAPADADAATWTAVTSLAVPALTEAEITGTATAAGQELMIQPVSDNTTIKLDVVTSLQGAADVTFKDVVVTTDDSKIERGKAYSITLTFKQSGVEPTARITDWTSAAGSGTVQ